MKTKNETKAQAYWYWDDYGLLLRRNKVFENDNGRCDALWRTSFYYAYHPDTNGPYEYFVRNYLCNPPLTRHPECEVGISRDQVSAAIICAEIRGLYYCSQRIRKSLKWKLSDFHSQTIDFWLWHKSLDGSWWYRNLFLLLTLIQVFFIIPYNGLLRFFTGFETVDQANYTPRDLTKSQLKISKWMYPEYAWFILCHQVITVKNTKFRRIVEKVMSWGTERNNWVLLTLLGSYKGEMPENYRSMSGIRWNNRLDGSANSTTYFLSEEERAGIDMDKMMLDNARHIYEITHL